MTRQIKFLVYGLTGAVLLAGALIAGTVLFTGDDAPPVQAAAATATPATTPTFEPPTPAPTTTTPVPTLSAADLKVTPKVTKKQCFGSAGCNITVKIEVGYGGPDLPVDRTWEVTYELTGDESGPIIGSFELTGGRYDQNETSMSTRSSKTKIAVKVTDVSLVG